MRIVRYNYPAYRSFTPALSRFARSPWSGLETEIDRLFDAAIGGLSDAVASNQFPVDLYEDANHAFVRAELPGVNRDDIHVEMVEDYLTVTATRKTATGQGQSEQTQSLSRSIRIPEQVQADQVSAAYENGVLTVTLPKREETKPKKITVAVK